MSFPTPLSFLLSLLLVLTFGEAEAQRAVETPVFRTSVSMVLVPVTVTDHNGKTIDGLRADDFTFFDDQNPRRSYLFLVTMLPVRWVWYWTSAAACSQY
jgi:hypothetical protein